MKPKWTTDDIPDLSGKVAIVTGANIGLGLEIAKQLAKHDAEVIMACRTPGKAEKAKEELKSELNEKQLNNLKVLQLDVSSFSSVRSFVDEFTTSYTRLDILMCNAGIMAIEERKESVDGYELQFATNHLGHFLLCGLLLNLLQQTEDSRIVTQSSSGHWHGKFNFDDLNCKKEYVRWDQYSMTKLANVCFAMEFNNRNSKNTNNPKAFSVHPGLVIGQLQQVQAGNSWIYKSIYSLFSPLAGTYQSGALPALYACTADDVNVGEFYGPDGFLNGYLRGNHPKSVEPNKMSRDPEITKKLWDISEELTDFTYGF